MTRQEKALLTKEKIYAQTLNLINEKGYDNVLIEDITQAAGIAKGTFYYYFKSREQLLYYTFKHVDQYYLEALEEAKKQADYPAMIDAFIRSSYKKIESLGKEVLRAVCVNLSTPESKLAFLDKERGLYLALEHIIKTGIANGFISDKRPPAFYVEKITIMLVGLDNYWVLSEQREGLPDVAADSVHALIKGFANGYH